MRKGKERHRSKGKSRTTVDVGVSTCDWGVVIWSPSASYFCHLVLPDLSSSCLVGVTRKVPLPTTCYFTSTETNLVSVK